MIIKAADIQKSYGSLKVLKSVNLEVQQGEVISIVGPSGAGKSTLLHIIGTLDKADSGKVFIEDIDISKLSSGQLAALRNQKLGFIFQFHHLLPEFNALENVCMPAYIAGKSTADVRKRALELLRFLGLSERTDHKPSELSGGEQQRVAVARSLINDPLVIMADEPSGNLDSKNALELHNLFFKLREEFNQTFIIVTHNEELAQMADRQLEMVDGQIVSNNEILSTKS